MTEAWINQSEQRKTPEVNVIEADNQVQACIDDRPTAAPLHFISDGTTSLQDLRNGKFQEIIELQEVKRRQASEHGIKYPAGLTIGLGLVVQAEANASGYQLEPEQIMDYMFEWEKANGRTPTVHTAQGYGPSNHHYVETFDPLCGAVQLAKGNPHEVDEDLQPDQPARMVQRFYDLAQSGSQVEIHYYTGDHAPKGKGAVAIFNQSFEATTSPTLPGTLQYRIDEARADQQITAPEDMEKHTVGLIPFLAKKGLQLHPQSTVARSHKQTQAILPHLVNRNDWYNATVTHGSAVVTPRT